MVQKFWQLKNNKCDIVGHMKIQNKKEKLSIVYTYILTDRKNTLQDTPRSLFI